MPASLAHAHARRAHNDAIRTLYEDTLVPVCEIARIAGVTERNIYALVRRLGCRPRVRLASGGGRRIVPLGASGEASPALDAERVKRALRCCRAAIARATRQGAATRAARHARSAAGNNHRAAMKQARVHLLLARTLRDLAALVNGPNRKARGAKPRRLRGYQWKPPLVSWPR